MQGTIMKLTLTKYRYIETNKKFCLLLSLCEFEPSEKEYGEKERKTLDPFCFRIYFLFYFLFLFKL